MDLTVLTRGLVGRPARQMQPRPWACVAVVLCPTGDGPEVLLIERAQRAGDPWSGHMALPGGRVEPGDVDDVATAIRETFEETGVGLTRAQLVGPMDDLLPHSRLSTAHAVRPLVFRVGRRPVVGTSDEVADWMWVPLHGLPSVRTRSDVSALDGSLVVDSYVCGGRVVWGLTYRVLNDVLDLTLLRTAA